MALVLDTGPMIATLDRSDADHLACRRLLQDSKERLIIPSPVLVEVDYWIHTRLYPAVRLCLLENIEVGAFTVESLQPQDYTRIRQLCERYADADIGFVDAAVLAIVERLGEPKLVTLDRRHFGMVRPRHVDVLELLPE